MFAPPSQLGLIARRLAAFVLVLWLAGVGCIIGCEMNTAAAAAPKAEAETATEEESCDASAGHDCCKKKKEKKSQEGAKGSVGFPQNDKHDSCCPLATLSADPARKISTKEAPAAIAANALHSAAASRIPNRFPSNKLRVPDRGSTYLRLCVFLI